jgi:predicted TIM-barrel fold metal-dependent hydrolase
VTVTDVSAFVGDYPYRGIQPATPEWLLSQMDRLGIESAWVGHLPSFLYRDPAPGNATLEKLLGPHDDRLSPVPVVHPQLPNWEDDLNRAAEIGAVAIRVYPMQQGFDPCGGEMRVLVAAAGSVGLPLLYTARFEDSRQRHPTDIAPDLPAAAVRTLIRTDNEVRFLITHADRAFVEEVHFGLTPGEAARLLWDISWIWGPPENDLKLLLETVGVERFILGTGMPLRIPDAAFAKLDLLALPDENRSLLMGGNLARWLPRPND